MENWLRYFDDDDLTALCDELDDALDASDADLLMAVVRDWRTTAMQLADPTMRGVLTGPLTPADFIEVGRP